MTHASTLTMIIKTLTVILLTAAAAFAQTGISESKPYKPREKTKVETVAPSTSTSQDVVIPLSVFDMKGTPVTDLTRANVSVFVDGVEAPVTGFEKSTELPNIILLLDMSPSAHLRIESIREQAEAFVEALPPGAKVLVAEFHSQMNIRTQLTDDRKAILSGIRKTEVDDGTSLYSAIQTLFQKVLPALPGRKVVVLFTDGVDTTSSKSSYASSLHEIEKSDVPVYTVFHDTLKDFPQRPGASIGPLGRGRFPFPLPPGVITGRPTVGSYVKEYEVGREYLGDLGSSTGARVLDSEKFDDVIKSFVAQLSAKYQVTISVPLTGSAGSKPLKVRVNRPDLIVLAKGSFID